MNFCYDLSFIVIFLGPVHFPCINRGLLKIFLPLIYCPCVSFVSCILLFMVFQVF